MGLVEGGRHTGSHRRPRLREAPGGRIEAFAVAACVGAPVCFGCGCGCDSRGGREDPEPEQRGAKTLALCENVLAGDFVALTVVVAVVAAAPQ